MRPESREVLKVAPGMGAAVGWARGVQGRGPR